MELPLFGRGGGLRMLGGASSLTPLSFPRPLLSTSLLSVPQEEKHDKDVWGQEEKKSAGEEAAAAGEAAEAKPAQASSRSSSAAAASAAAASDDLLGLSLPSSAPAAAEGVDAEKVPVTRRIGVEPGVKEGQLPKWLAAASSKASALLYDDAYVQVGVKRVCSGSSVTATLFLGNKMAVPLVALKVRVPENSALRVTVGDVPARLAPKGQAQVVLTIEALTPFVEPPALQISFIGEPGTGHAYALQVPVCVASFCERVALPAADYKQRWGALAGAPREATAIISPQSGAGAVSMEAAQAAVRDVLAMAQVEAGAPGATGASSFRTKTLAPNGAPISVGCLAMAIPDAAGGAFKVAIRTQHGDVSKSLLATLQAHLGAL